MVSEKKYDEVLGIHIIGPHATDLIGEAVMALQLETTAEEMAMAVHPHPTLTEAVNHLGRFHVATCAKAAGVGRYVLSSSCSVYGHGKSAALDEESPAVPLTPTSSASERL